jgi:transcription initiation factor TFIIB
MPLKTIKIETCPACSSTELEHLIEGQMVCRGCGLVINPEIKAEQHSKNEARKNEQNRPSADDLSGWQKLLKVSGSTERNAALILYYITKLAEELQLQQTVIEEAINIYRSLLKCSFKGKRLKAISAALVYASCKKLGIPLGLKVIAKAIGEDPKKVFRSYSFVIENHSFQSIQIGISEILDEICEMTEVDGRTLELAKRIVNALKDSDSIQGKNPYGYIAAALYIASKLAGKKRTEREISEITRVTEATIRKRYKEIISRYFTVFTS